MKKTYSRWTSLVLCCVSLLGIFVGAVPALALEEITSAAVTVTVPASGASPVLEASVSADAPYTVTNVQWSTTEPFAAGQTYQVRVTLQAVGDGFFSSQLTATVNAVSCRVEGLDSAQDAIKEVTLVRNFTVSGQIVDTVSLSGLTVPEQGGVPDMSLIVPPGELYAVEQVLWQGWRTADGPENYFMLSASETFQPGYSYQIAVLLKTVGNGAFRLNSQGAPQVTVAIDGAVAHAGAAVSGKSPSEYIQTGMVFKIESDKTPIDSVIITDVTPPSIGKKPTLTAKVPTDALYTVDEVIWKRWGSGFSEPVDMGSRETFEEDTNYQVTVILKAKENSAFTLDGHDDPMVSATLNDNPTNFPTSVGGKDPAQYISVSYTFHSAEELIEDVSILALDEPEEGELPDYEVEVPVNAHYEVEQVVWKWRDAQNSGSRFEKMTFADVFNFGKEYQVCVTLVAREYAEFATNTTNQPQVTVKVNGEPAKPAAAIKDKEATRYIEVTYEYLLESNAKVIDRVAVDDLDMPMAGSTPDTEATVSSVAKYEIHEIIWEKMQDGTAKKTDKNYTFRAGENYRVTVVLKADENAEFSVGSTGRTQVEGFLNGKTATVSSVSGKDLAEYISLSAEFVIYTVQDGDGTQWTPQKGTLRLRFSGDAENVTDIIIDDTVIKKNLYTVSRDAVVIELSSQLLASLADGTHQLKVVYVDGLATAEFEVYNDGSVPSSQGGQNNSTMWIIIICVAVVVLCGAAVLSIFLRKKGWL